MIDIIIVGIYLTLVLVLGLYSSRKVTSSKEFISGGGQYKALAIFATLTASFIGGGFTTGLAEKTFTYGIVFILAIWGFSLKEYLISKFIAPKMDQFKDKAVTTGDIMEISFGKSAKIFTGIASILVCGGIIGAQFLACGNILNILLGLPQTTGSLLVAAIILIYSSLGGLRSVVIADILHLSVLITVLPLVMFFGIHYAGGMEKIIATLPETHLEPFGKIGFGSFIIVFLSFFFGETLIPPYVQRLLIGKTANETAKGTLYSSLISLLFFAIIGIIGLSAYVIDPTLEAHKALPFVIKTTMPVGLKGLAIAAMIAVVMSSADSFLNATSIALKKDILQPLGFTFDQNPSKDLLASRLITLILGVIAITASLLSTSTLDLLLYSYQFWTPFILVPLIAAILGVRANAKTFIFPAIYGILTLLVWNIYNPLSIGVDGALEGVIAGIIVNSIAFYICLRRYKAIKNK